MDSDNIVILAFLGVMGVMLISFSVSDYLQGQQKIEMAKIKCEQSKDK